MENEKGQSTIEFIMTFSMIFAFFFLFLKMAMNFTDGYMVHHATYMASRAYLSYDNDTRASDPGTNDDMAFKFAKTVFTKYLPDGLIKNFDGELKANPPTGKFQIFTGLYIDYTTPFSIGVIGGKETMTMRSESFLGREPSRFEGYEQTCLAIRTVTGASCDNEATLDDNGG